MAGLEGSGVQCYGQSPHGVYDVHSKRLAGWMLAGILGLAPVGCVSYSTYPSVQGLAPSSPNFIFVQPVVRESVLEVTKQFHPESAGTYAVNLPKGMTIDAQLRIINSLGPQALPLSASTTDRPIYHVGRIWVRGRQAKVDVIRPVLELGPSPSGETIYQGMTVWLEGGAYPWGVMRVQPWSLGVVAPPELNLIPEIPAEPTP